MSHILIATSTTDFDPTEVAVPWDVLTRAGHDITFATDTGEIGQCDMRMINGQGFGILKPFLVAPRSVAQTYSRLLEDPAFKAPIPYDAIRPENYDALLLPGGHAKGIIPYLESATLHHSITAFFRADKPVGAICHGVVAACRAVDQTTGKSVLHGRKTTALLNRQELLAWQLTRRKLGDYYRTYPITVEDEVRTTLEFDADFIQGPLPLLRDDPKHLSRGFTVTDKNYLSARWPGDAYRFAIEFDKLLVEAAG